jgi:hypothetical protein
VELVATPFVRQQLTRKGWYFLHDGRRDKWVHQNHDCIVKFDNDDAILGRVNMNNWLTMSREMGIYGPFSFDFVINPLM